MPHHVPTAGGVLTIIGGALVTLVGIALAVVGAFLGAFGFAFAWLFFIGLGVGILLIVMGILALARPQGKTVWGVLIIVLAIASLPTALGGLFLGFLLALIGGILVLVHKPPMVVTVGPMGYYPGQPLPSAVPVACPSCGGAINPATRTCLACGLSV